jgi:ribonuclease HI
MRDKLLAGERITLADLERQSATKGLVMAAVARRHRPAIQRLVTRAILAVQDRTKPLRYVDKDSIRNHWAKHAAAAGIRSTTCTTVATDGSYDPRDGTGGASVTHHDGEATLHIPRCTSSTHAELTAILLALLTNESSERIVIHTDSMAAIGALHGHARARSAKEKNRPNRAIIRAIRELMNDGTRPVGLAHVRAHTTNEDEVSRLNRRADIEANRARVRGGLTAPDLTHYGDPYGLTWCGATIDARVYSVVYAGISRRRMVNHSNASNTGAMFVRTDVWVEASFHTLRDGKPPERAFRWKSLTRTLPTLSRQHARDPRLYPSNVCVGCGCQVETATHIFTECPGYANERKALETLIEDTYGSLTGTRPPTWFALPPTDWPADASAAGLIPSEVETRLRESIPADLVPKAGKTLGKAVTRGLRAVWRSRCGLIRQHGLTYGTLLRHAAREDG